MVDYDMHIRLQPLKKAGALINNLINKRQRNNNIFIEKCTFPTLLNCCQSGIPF